MSKHALEPWIFDHGGGHMRNAIVSYGDFHKRGKHVGERSWSDTICSDLGDPDLPEVAANIALICAAPDLLAALRAAEAFIAGAEPKLSADRNEAISDVLPQIRAVLARVEGKT